MASANKDCSPMYPIMESELTTNFLTTVLSVCFEVFDGCFTLQKLQSKSEDEAVAWFQVNRVEKNLNYSVGVHPRCF
jgi:hypothetical protein